MKKTIQKFCKSNEKKNTKLLKKMFGCKELSDGIKLEKSLRDELETRLKKDISLVDFSDVRGNSYLMYTYTKYRTLETFINLIFNERKLKMYVEDLEGVKNEC